MRPNLFIDDYLDKEKDKLFLKYCRENNYQYLHQITDSDYIVFAVKYKLGRQKYKEVQSRIEKIKNDAYQGKTPVNLGSDKVYDTKIMFGEKDSVAKMNLSNRSYNSLLKARVRTIFDLFVKSEKEIKSIRSLGVKSFNEVMKARRMYFPEPGIVYKVVNLMNERVKEEIISLLLNERPPRSNLKKEDNEIAVIEYAKESINNIGIEIARYAYKRPKETLALMEALQNFSKVNLYSKDLLAKFDQIPGERRAKRLSQYTDIINDEKILLELEPLEEELEQIDKVYELKDIIPDVCADDDKRRALVVLLDYLGQSLRKTCLDDVEKTISVYTTIDIKEVLVRRYNKETLQNISESYDVTREWVRQLESRAKKAIAQSLSRIGFDVFAFMVADLNKDILKCEEINEYLGKDEDGEFLCNILTELVTKTTYCYDTRAGILVPKSMEKQLEKAEKEVLKLEKIIPQEKIEKILTQIHNKHKIDKKILIVYFKKYYKLYGKMYCRGSLTLQTIYEYILKNYYPKGIKLYEDKEIEKFKARIWELFGNIRLPKSAKAISARIVDIGVLYDRGVHIHKSYVHISDELVEKIKKYIDESHKIIVSYAELFNYFKDELKEYNINNRFNLQGLLKPELDKSYIMGKDYVSKEEGWTIDKEIERFVLTNGRVTKQEICDEFLGMKDIVFSTNIKKNGNIIAKEDGVYIHASELDIVNEDYEKLRKLLVEHTEKIPVSARKIHVILKNNYQDFLTRNDINSHSELFDVLRYMFGKEFKFSRPFIAKLGTVDACNLDVAKRILADYDVISIDDIVDIFNQNHIIYLSLRSIMIQLNDEFLQVSKGLMGRIKEEVMTEKVKKTILNKLHSLIAEKGYIAGRAVDDFKGFPDIGYPWNPYLLRSVTEKYFADKIGMVDVLTSSLTSMNTIFVKKEFSDMSYSEFLEYVIKRRHEKHPFKNSKEVREWVKNERLDLKVKQTLDVLD